MYFEYGEAETEYLRRRDKRLSAVIEQVGHIDREVDDNLYASVVHHIIGQQVSTKAQQTIWLRLQDAFGAVEPQALAGASRDELQALGMTFRKADYILDFSRKVVQGDFDLAAVEQMPDDEAIRALVSLKGVGVWTAEMILLFCLQRPNILSFDDLAIQRGMRMVYRHRTIDREQFERYRRRLSPCCSVASLYFWATSAGAIPGLTDPGKSRQGGTRGKKGAEKRTDQAL